MPTSETFKRHRSLSREADAIICQTFLSVRGLLKLSFTERNYLLVDDEERVAYRKDYII